MQLNNPIFINQTDADIRYVNTTGDTINGNIAINGNLNALGNYYVKLARLSDQTVTAGADAVIQFSGITDPNNWYNTTTYRITPTISGNYCANVMASWKQGSVARNNQTNIQIRKGATTIALTQAPVESGLNFSVYATAIATLNGTTGDYIDVTAFTSNTTSQNLVGEVNGSWTKIELFKLN